MSKLAVPRVQTSKPTRVFIQDSGKSDGSGLTGLVYNSGQLTTPGSAPTTAAPSGAGNIDVGSHVWAVSFINGPSGETPVSANSTAQTTSGGAQQVALSAIPTGATGTTGRKLYRSKAGTTTPLFLLTTISDNTTTTYTDNSTDASLGANPQTINTTGLYLTYHREGDAAVTPVQLVTATLGTFTSAGFIEASARYAPGVYEVGIPDAVWASGNACLVMLRGAPSMVPLLLEFDLGSDLAVIKPAGNIRADGTGMNVQQALIVAIDLLTSVVTNAGTANPSISKNGATLAASSGHRMDLTSDASGNRSAITVDPS